MTPPVRLESYKLTADLTLLGSRIFFLTLATNKVPLVSVNMDELLDQIESACASGNFYLALFCCLTLPDICGAISADDGRARGKRFIAWFDKYVAAHYGANFTGAAYYAFRCSVLHQGRSKHPDLGYERVLFVAPTSGVAAHNNIINGALNLDISDFCADVIGGVRQWLRDEVTNPTVQNNLATFLKRYPGGLKPYFVGVDVYS